MRTGKCVACIFSWAGLPIFCLIYWPILLLIWVPYLTVDWESSTCIVESVTNYEFKSASSDDNGDKEEISLHYARFNVLVNVSNHWMKGFGCGTPNSHGILGTAGPSGDMPTSHGVCPKPDICGKELFLPAWYCSECEICDEFLTGQPSPCQWTLYSSSSPHWPDGFSAPYPHKNTDFIEVVMGDEVYSSFAEFIVLNVLVGGGMVLICLSILGMIICFLLKKFFKIG